MASLFQGDLKLNNNFVRKQGCLNIRDGLPQFSEKYSATSTEDTLARARTTIPGTTLVVRVLSL
jgi:hypothetical protein